MSMDSYKNMTIYQWTVGVGSAEVAAVGILKGQPSFCVKNHNGTRYRGPVRDAKVPLIARSN